MQIPVEMKDRFVIKVEKSKTVELVERAVELTDAESQYRIPWIVFDRDQVKDFDEIIRTAEKIVSIPDGRIHVLKSGCIHILERCLPSGNPIHDVIVLQRNLRRLQDRNI